MATTAAVRGLHPVQGLRGAGAESMGLVAAATSKLVTAALLLIILVAGQCAQEEGETSMLELQ